MENNNAKKKGTVTAVILICQIMFGVMPIFTNFISLLTSFVNFFDGGDTSRLASSFFNSVSSFIWGIIVIVVLGVIKKRILLNMDKQNGSDSASLKFPEPKGARYREYKTDGIKPVVSKVKLGTFINENANGVHEEIYEKVHESTTHDHNKWGAYDFQLNERQTTAKLGLMCPRCGETVYAPITEKHVRCPKCFKKIDVN